MTNGEHIPEIERLKAISARLLSPELAFQLIDDAPDAWVVVDDDGRIVLFNRQAELLFGYTRVEMIGQPVELLLPETKRDIHAGFRERYMSDPQIRPMGRDLDLEARHKKGNTIPVLINLSPRVTSDGTFVSAAIRRKDGRRGA